MIAFKNLYTWMGKQIHNPYASWLLGLLFFLEAIFFVPIDPILILFCLEQRNRTWFFAFIATLCSVLGGICSYAIGYLLWDLIGQKIILLLFCEKQFHYVLDFYRHYETAAVLMAGFIPIPYKLVTLSAGFCKLPLIPFIIGITIARTIRFYLIAGVAYYWGATVKDLLDRFFNIFILLFLVFCVSAWWLTRYLVH